MNQMTEDGGQRSEVRDQQEEGRGRKADVKGQKSPMKPPKGNQFKIKMTYISKFFSDNFSRICFLTVLAILIADTASNLLTSSSMPG